MFPSEKPEAALSSSHAATPAPGLKHHADTATIHGWRRWFRRHAGVAGWLIIVAGIVTSLLPADVVLGAPHTDLINQFAASRAFAADSIRAGDFPLWNPYLYAGQPFLGGSQSALLYPPNVVFLFLPLARAINFSILLHVMIAGWGMAHWVSQRGQHRLAAILAGAILALSGTVLPHVYAGHLSNLCTLAWVPWAFAGLEKWSRGGKASGLLLASAAVALQILGGQLQYVFFFGVAAALHALVISLADRSSRRRAIPGLAIAVAAGSLLAAAQLLPVVAAAGESVRSGKLDYDFAAVFALPPENLLTAIAPNFFGTDPNGVPYWGRCYPWEMSLFVGIGAIGFAALGLRRREPGGLATQDLLVAVLLLVLALGSNLPLYRLLYDYVPGFDRFRGMSKFTFPATLFGLLLTARGIDAFIRGRVPTRLIAITAMLAGLALAAGGLYLRSEPHALFRAIEAMRMNPENDFPAAWFAAPDFPGRAAQNASTALLVTAVLAIGFGASLGLGRRFAVFRWTALLLIPVELVGFTVSQTAVTPLALAVMPDVKKIVTENPGDYRVLNLLRPNNGYLLGAPDLWGNDPLVLKRYAEFMTFTQKGNPDAVSQNLSFETLHPLLTMLRARFAFSLGADGPSRAEFGATLPRALLVADYRVRSGRDAIFSELAEPGFDPRHIVVLETEPTPRPDRTAQPGSVRVLGATSDRLDLEVATAAPSILLVTDLFSRGWRVTSLAPAPQKSYTIIPANYVLRAVPLSAGIHRLRMEYSAPGLALGIALSVAAALAWIAAAFDLAIGGRRPLVVAPQPVA